MRRITQFWRGDWQRPAHRVFILLVELDPAKAAELLQLAHATQIREAEFLGRVLEQSMGCARRIAARIIAEESGVKPPT
jgi:hypothetical protein